MPNIITSVKYHYNGTMPAIVLTERDPKEYVTRRLHSRHAARDIICKETTTITPKTLENGAFDFIGCIERYLSGLSEEEANNATVGQIFTTIGKLYNNIGDETFSYAAKQVKEYQDAVRSIADFSIDLFVKKEKVTAKILADEMMSKADALQPLDNNCEYVNFRTKTRIDGLS